jgi:hypothetical protein
VTASLAGMTRLRRGDITLGAALEDRRLDAHGPPRLRRRLRDRLNLSPLAAVPSQREEAGKAGRNSG